MERALVRTRSIVIYSPEGDRLKKPLWGKARLWKKYRDTASNLLKAIDYAGKALQSSKGTVVYIGEIPVYHAKIGTTTSFTGWKNNPVANLWHRKLESA